MPYMPDVAAWLREMAEKSEMGEKDDLQRHADELGELIKPVKHDLHISQDSIFDPKERLRRLLLDHSLLLNIQPPANDEELKCLFDQDPSLALHFQDLSVDVQFFLIERSPMNIQYINHTDSKVEAAAIYWQGAGIAPDEEVFRLIKRPHSSTELAIHKALR